MTQLDANGTAEMLRLATEEFPVVRLLNGIGWVDPVSGKAKRPPDATEFAVAPGRTPSALSFHAAALPEEVPIVSGGGPFPVASPTFEALQRMGYEDAAWLIADRPGAAVALSSPASIHAPGRFRAAAAVAALKALGGWDETNPISVMTSGGSFIVHLSWNRDPTWRSIVVSMALPWKAFVQQLTERLSPDSRLTLVAFDWDKALVFNDAYGHVEGDLVLARIAQVVATNAARAGVSFARVAGDEFAAVFAEGDEEAAELWAEGVVSDVRQMSIPFQHPEIATRGIVTVTACVATANASALASLVSRCEELILLGKQRGGDTVVRSTDARSV